MFLNSYDIKSSSTPSEIVSFDYRTSEVFNKYGIEFCCGGNWSLEAVAKIKGIELGSLIMDLHSSMREMVLPNTITPNEWKIDFLIDYLINIHHQYLRETLPSFGIQIEEFAKEHTKNAVFPTLLAQYNKFEKEMLSHIEYEEKTIFPYLRRLYHAYTTKESYAGLLIRTLRKPIENTMEQEHQMTDDTLKSFRMLTNDYTAPQKACINHRVILAKLKEIDNNLVQHLDLEINILFPRVLSMEKELERQIV